MFYRACTSCRWNMFTELLRSNDGGHTHADTVTASGSHKPIFIFLLRVKRYIGRLVNRKLQEIEVTQ
jgi:hypothetical protein